MARIEDRGPFRAPTNRERSVLRKGSKVGETEKPDILLDAPRLEAKDLALEIEDLNLANLVRIGKVRLEVQSLDAELFLQTHLGDLLHSLDLITSTANLGLTLFFAPVYNFNRAADAWYENGQLARRWFELPIRMAEERSRPEISSARRPSLPAPGRSAGRPANEPEDHQVVRHIVNRDGDVVATVFNEKGQVLEEALVGRLKFLPQEETNGESETTTGDEIDKPAKRFIQREVDLNSGRTVERTLNDRGEVIEEWVLKRNEENENPADQEND